MSVPQTLAIFLLVVASAVAGAAGAGAFSSGTSVDQETTPPIDTSQQKTISEPENIKRLDTTTDPTYPENTIGHKDTNKPHLVNVKETINKEWWDWVYENRFEKENKKADKQIHSLFSGVNKGFEEITNTEQTNSNALNHVCHKAYNSMWYDILPQNHLLENIKLFCSWKNSQSVTEPNESKPTTYATLSEQTDVTIANTKLGNKNTNNTILVAPIGIQNKNNKNWWSYVFKKHFLAKKAESSFEIKDPFKKVVSPYSENEISTEENNETSLNQACLKAYKKDLTISDVQIKKNINFFCTKDNTENSSLKFDNN